MGLPFGAIPNGTTPKTTDRKEESIHMTHWLSHVASDVATVLELIGHWITFNTFGGST